MIRNSQRTIYGLNLTMNMLMGLPHSDLINTTLNEKFNLYPREPIAGGVYPRVRYLTIGIGGNGVTDNNVYKYSKHRATDAALFEHTPFIMRPLTSDLTGSEQLKYRLRVVENHGGTDYACYYGKVITDFINRPSINELHTTNGVTVIKELTTNDASILSPTPRLITNYLDKVNNSYTVKTAKVSFNLYNDDLTEINNAMIIRNGVTSNLTEIGIVSGIDAVKNGITELVNASIYYFAEIDVNLQIYLNENSDLIKTIELGGMEPILK